MGLAHVAHTNVVWPSGPQGWPGSGPRYERHALRRRCEQSNCSTGNCSIGNSSIGNSSAGSCLLQGPAGYGLGISGDLFCQEAVVTCPMGDLCWMPLATSLAQHEEWNPSSMSDPGRSATRLWNGSHCSNGVGLSGSKSKPSRRREGFDFSSA